MAADQETGSTIRFGREIEIVGNAMAAQSVAAADLDSDGDLDVLSASWNDGKIRWYRNSGDLSPSLSSTIIDTLAGAYTAIAADLNGDGAVDVLAAGVGQSNEPARLVWYRNSGATNPSFSRQPIADGLAFPAALSTADMDNDGDLDLLLVERNGDRAWWYENGGGSVPRFTAYVISDSLDGATSIKAGDLDLDGDVDVVVAAENNDTIAWFRNNGGRPIQFDAHIIRSATQAPSSPDLDYVRTVDLSDINRDGKLDVVYGSDAGDEVGWYENDGGAVPQFRRHIVYTGLDAVKSVVAADVDRDGDDDIVAGGGDQVFVLENNGDLTPQFSARQEEPLAKGIRMVAVFDINGDGHRDLLSASQDDNRIVWRPNQMMHRSAFFSAQTRSVITVRRSSRMAHSGDLDHDGDVDVVSIANDELLWHENDGRTPPSFQSHVIESDINGGRWVHVADVDGDGDDDVVSAIPASNRVAWHENIGGTPTRFVLHVITTNANGARAALAADLDGDGDLDVYSASHGDNKIAWYENKGGRPPSFQEHVVTREADYARSVFAADLDGDGALDLISASQQDDEINWYRNNRGEPPTFQRYRVGIADGVQHVEAADIDGDGDSDILAASEFDSTVAWYENTGEALPNFIWHPVDRSAGGVHAVHADDFDGDGDVDLVAAIEYLNAIKWYENDGASPPRFSQHLVYDRAVVAHGIHADDIDTDGDIDIVGISREDGVVAWFENRGGNYAIEVIPPSSSAASILTQGDLTKVLVAHRGRPGDANVQLNSLELVFVDHTGVQVDAGRFKQNVRGVYLYQDTSDGVFDPDEDRVIVWLDSPTLDDQGRLTIPLPIGSNAFQIGPEQTQTFFMMIRSTGPCAVPFDPAIWLSQRLARDSRHLTPLLAESVAGLTEDDSNIETERPNYLWINEFMASNDSSMTDPDEPTEYPDWLELYNAAPYEIDLSGMYLTDDLADPTKYRIPDNVTVPARGYLLFIADGEETQGALHTNFRLSGQGESIGLFDTTQRNNQVIDAITYSEQPADVTFGRDPGDQDEWTVLGSATPGAANKHEHMEWQFVLPIISSGSTSSSTCP